MIDKYDWSHRKTAREAYESLISICSTTPNRPGQLEGSLDNGYIYKDRRTTVRLYIKKVIFNPPATIVFWSDDTKTIVKCQEGDFFDPEKGLTTAISKKFFGNKGNYCNELKKWLKECNIYYDNVTDDPLTGAAYNAYQRLLDTMHDKKSTKADLRMAMKEAIGYLGEVLAE